MLHLGRHIPLLVIASACVLLLYARKWVGTDAEQLVASGGKHVPARSPRSSDIPAEHQYYVSIAVAVFSASSASRDMDYLFLTPLTALNWHNHGFHPLIFLVSNTTEDFFSAHQLHVLASLRQLQKDDILSLYIVPNIPTNYVIPISQTIRLFTALIDPGRLLDAAFLRLTDVDVWIVDSAPFLRPPTKEDIDCYGTFIYGKSTMGTRQCTQILMHSVGMEMHLWRSLFGRVIMSNEQQASREVERWAHCAAVKGNDVLASVEQELVKAITALLWDEFKFDGTKPVAHGDQPYWYMDQILLGCALEDYLKSSPGVRIRQTGKPMARLHLWDHLDARELPTVDGSMQPIADIHLADFAVAKDLEKIQKLLRERDIVPAAYATWTKEYYEKWQAGEVASAECYAGRKTEKVPDAPKQGGTGSLILAILIFFCVGVLTGVMLRSGDPGYTCLDTSSVPSSARRFGRDYDSASNEEVLPL
eukprot:GEMP01043332.1.p1 GENE.GEMP01043332.1~~GEMP01043332.1.p1  ORF type:complete len:496 (+),score=114.83 GEMP01043332.1:62-1489(+)